MRTLWAGRTITTNIQLGGAFWIFLTIVFLVLAVWLSGWGPRLKEAAKSAFQKEFAHHY